MNIVAEIQYLQEDGHWYVRLCFDGHEVERWGPYLSRHNAILLAQEASKRMFEIARDTPPQ